MISNEEYQLDSIVEMKKAHPCVTRSKQFMIVRLGADIKIKCLGCGNVVMLSRNDFNEKVKKIIKKWRKTSIYLMEVFLCYS